jgi:hypothetical protein
MQVTTPGAEAESLGSLLARDQMAEFVSFAF